MMRAASARLALAIFIACPVGCKPAPPRAADVPLTPVEARKTRVELPRATLADGSTVTLEIASTPEEISRGLMFRPSLAADRGMLFLFGHERLPSFWMKNTLIALDIIFLDSTGTIVDLVIDAQPCKVEPCPQYVPKLPAAAVLEVPGGTAAQHGIAEGQKITFERVGDYPLVHGD
jgi:uncharacterized membrane protein (UPF0127 family)